MNAESHRKNWIKPDYNYRNSFKILISPYSPMLINRRDAPCLPVKNAEGPRDHRGQLSSKIFTQ